MVSDLFCCCCCLSVCFLNYLSVALIDFPDPGMGEEVYRPNYKEHNIVLRRLKIRQEDDYGNVVKSQLQ